ncbi:Uncharacterised protein [Pasteurella canis]|nr:Uncharacterised protein [Pasteurella canis]
MYEFSKTFEGLTALYLSDSLKVDVIHIFLELESIY